MPVFTRLAKKLGLRYEGIQKGFGAVKDMHLFTDSKTGSTLAVRSQAELASKVKASRKKFGVGTAVGAGVLATAQPDEAEAGITSKMLKTIGKLLQTEGKVSRRDILKGAVGAGIIAKTLKPAGKLLKVESKAARRQILKGSKVTFSSVQKAKILESVITKIPQTRKQLTPKLLSLLSDKERKVLESIYKNTEKWEAVANNLSLPDTVRYNLMEKLYPKVHPGEYILSTVVNKLKPSIKDFKNLNLKRYFKNNSIHNINGVLFDTPFALDKTGKLFIKNKERFQKILGPGLERPLNKRLKTEVSRRELFTGKGIKKVIAPSVIGATALSQIEEAEAMPIGRFIPAAKAAAKELGGTVSSTANRVIGTPIRDKVIANVIKAKKGDWRYLIFEDGSSLPITKDYLQDLVRSVGTTKQMKKLGELRPKGLPAGKVQRQITRQKKQAGISLTRRAGAASEGTLGTTKQTREFKEASMERLRELDPALVPETTYVQYEGRTLFMPKGYADILEKQGKVKILKGKPKVGIRPFKNPFERKR